MFMEWTRINIIQMIMWSIFPYLLLLSSWLIIGVPSRNCDKSELLVGFIIHFMDVIFSVTFGGLLIQPGCRVRFHSTTCCCGLKWYRWDPVKHASITVQSTAHVENVMWYLFFSSFWSLIVYLGIFRYFSVHYSSTQYYSNEQIIL